MTQKARAQTTVLQPTLHVGKYGIEKVAQELKKQLKAQRMVKVKFLRAAFVERGRKELAEKLASLTDSELLELRGNTAMFRRKG